MKKPLTTGEAGKYCNVNYMTIAKWIKQGKLKAHRTPGGRYRIQPNDLVEFLNRYEMPVPEELQSETRILVIDDEPSVVQFIIDALQNEKQKYELVSALNGYDAAMQLVNFKPHVVILDIRMPGLDGIQVCRDIKNNPETKDIKILAITGKAKDDEVEEILRCGAEHCLLKPFQVDELMGYVAKLSQAV
ncbi:MAG: response regulator [Deltaproteobacteria bacterium]|nr:response regulator [Deltaproteobacteria bacterium]